MAGAYLYLTRIVPVLSLVGVAVVLLFAFVVSPYQQIARGQQHDGETTFSQLLLSAYTIFLHVLSVLFPARVFWAMSDVIKKMEATKGLTKWPRRRKTRVVKDERGSTTYSTPTFVIIVPAYKEEVSTLEETLKVLGSHVQARDSYHVYLAMEEKEENVAEKAERLVAKFKSSFQHLTYTIHPYGIKGQSQGKSSNEDWAAQQASKDIPDSLKSDVIITVMDADTHLSQRYFAQVAKHHLEQPQGNQETIYVPPIVFDRNLDQVPLPVRTADLMWAGAGISNLYPGSQICIPTSVYSLPMTLVERVGGWDTDPGSIGEDMHMYLKCFFALSGNLRVKVVYAAASQCNVSSDKTGLAGFVDGMDARYKQALRHMWGTLDTGFAVRQTVRVISRHHCASLVRRRTWTFSELAAYGRHALLAGISTVCSANLVSLADGFAVSKPPAPRQQVVAAPALRPMHKLNIMTVFLRLFEAHFLPLHLSLILTISTLYESFSGLQFPSEFAMALKFCNCCRWIGWALVIAFFYRYEQYLRLCVRLRKEEMRDAGLLDKDDEDRGYCDRVFKWFGVLEAGIFPLGGFIFGAFPAFQAIISHVFTERLTYHVSLKPQFIAKHLQVAAPLAAAPAKAVRVPASWRNPGLFSMDQILVALQYRPVKRDD